MIISGISENWGSRPDTRHPSQRLEPGPKIRDSKGETQDPRPTVHFRGGTRDPRSETLIVNGTGDPVR